MHRVLAGLFAIALLRKRRQLTERSRDRIQPSAFRAGWAYCHLKRCGLLAPVAGDEIATSDTPVLITLSDGTEVLVNANSKIKITLVDNKVKVVIVSGNIDNDWWKHHRRWCWIEPPTGG